MKKTAVLNLGIGFLLLSLICGSWFYFKRPNQSDLVSPVLGVSTSRFSDNIWLPQESSTSAFLNVPDITAQSALFVEGNTGEVLYQKDPKRRVPIASLTKIMTAIVALENSQLTDTFTVSKQASEMEPDTMYLKEGEKLNVEELLSGIFLVSANDAAETIAENVTGDRAQFVQMMNQKAQLLGMLDTLFINPSGLEEDDIPAGLGKLKLHYSSAYDVLLMSRYLIHRWPDIIKITASDHIFLPTTETHRAYDLYNGINLITTYPGVIGLKIGFTPEAGLTIVTVARKGNKEVIGVLLNSTNRRDDTKAMLDYSFQKLGVIVDDTVKK